MHLAGSRDRVTEVAPGTSSISPHWRAIAARNSASESTISSPLTSTTTFSRRPVNRNGLLYFKGDWMRVGNPGGVEETVEQIGLRRTQLRDGMGSLHAVSNGLIRQSTNATRTFSVATVDVQVLHARELDRAFETAMRVVQGVPCHPSASGAPIADGP
jgi:hypothetical protein